MRKGSGYKEIIETINRGGDLCCKLRERYYKDSSMFTVFLFSEDADINRHTVYFLPVHALKYRVSCYLVVSPVDGMKDIVSKYIKVPYRFVKCTKQEAHDIGRYCTEPDERKRNREHILINGTDDPEEYRYVSVLGVKGITKTEIVANCVFDFRYTPSRKEVEQAVLNSKNRFRYRSIKWEEYDDMIPVYHGEKQGIFEETDEEIEKLITSGKICKDDKLVLFSDTKTTRHIIEYLKDYRIIAVLDNDIEKNGTSINGIPVFFPEVFFNSKNRIKCIKIIVPTRSYIPICEQLYYHGLELGKDVFVTYKRRVESYDEVREWYEGIKQGEEFYDDIRKKHPEDRIYMCTYEGTGDIYLIGMYLKDRMEHDGASKCVVVAASAASRKLLETFDLRAEVSEIVVLNGRKECNRLLYFVRGIGYEKANAAVLNNDYGVMLLKRLSGLNGIDFNTLFQKIIFFSDKKRTKADMKQISSDDIFLEEGLRPGRTVLLSPYANTTYGIAEEAWEKLAEDLTGAGYDVCTNVSGNNEKAVKGTKGVFIPYSKLIDFLDKAGGFVGLRSGLCDIISGSSANKVILYPEKAMFHNSRYIDYFSLGKMFDINTGLLEFTVREDETDISEKVLSGLKIKKSMGKRE